ncbi:unnamed protein product, partial [Rotaria sordida]
MVDIENELNTIPEKLSFTNSTSDNRSTASSVADILAIDFHTSTTSVVSIVINADNDNNDEVPLFSIRQINKNFFVLLLAFILLFTAYSGIISLQSSLNVKGNVGINSLVVTHAFILFSATFLTSTAVDLFGLKWAMIIGEIGYILYILANIRPLPLLMYIAAALVGLGSAPLWTSQATYLSRIARYHSYHKQKKVEVIISLFSGIFFAFFGTMGIWGNLISYFVLNQSNHPQKFNCGIHFDPQSNTVVKEPHGVHETTRSVLCATFAGMGVVSALLLLFFLDQIRLAKPRKIFVSDVPNSI